MADVKKIKRMIVGEVIEIVIVLTLLVISIPVWNNFVNKFSKANVTTLDDYRLNFGIKKVNDVDVLSVYNDYYIDKEFKIYLVVNKMVSDKTEIYVDGRKYKLKEFQKSRENDNDIYTIVDTVNKGGITSYYVKSSNKSVNYSYIFEENNKF